MEIPAQGGASECLTGKYDADELTANSADIQAAARAIETGLALLPDPMRAAPILSRRLTIPQNTWLAETGLLALPRSETELVTSDALSCVQAGEPIPPFISVRDAAVSWATFASPAESRAYLAAIWNRLSEKERQGFVRAAKKKSRQS